jgi:hypothetical protein
MDQHDAADTSADALWHLHELLHSEISAEVAYRVVGERMAKQPDSSDYVGLLRRLEGEHAMAAAAVRNQISDLGAEAWDPTGPMGAWSAVVQCSKAQIGGRDRTSLAQLHLAEKLNLRSYQAGAANSGPESAQLIINLLIPAQQRHVRVLGELLGRQCGPD